MEAQIPEPPGLLAPGEAGNAGLRLPRSRLAGMGMALWAPGEDGLHRGQEAPFPRGLGLALPGSRPADLGVQKGGGEERHLRSVVDLWAPPKGTSVWCLKSNTMCMRTISW